MLKSTVFVALAVLLMSKGVIGQSSSDPTTTNDGVVCELMSSQISVKYPIQHNCTSVPAGEYCVVNCDENQFFFGNPVVIECNSDGNIIPFGAVVCSERINTMEVDENGMHLIVSQGDVFVAVDGEEVGIMSLNNKVGMMDARLEVVEQFDLDTRVTTIEEADLSGEISSLSTMQSAAQAASQSSLENSLEELSTSVKLTTEDLSTAILGTAASTTSSISSLKSFVEQADTSLETLSSELSGEVSTNLVNTVSAIVMVSTSVEDNAANIETNTGDIGTLQDEMVVVEGLTNVHNRPGLSKENPGLTCSHILLSQNGKNLYGDGKYWIDPNGGDASDAINVFCDMTNGGWTKIDPDGMVDVGHHKTIAGDGRTWYAGPPFSYAIEDDQLQALIRHSTSAKQDAEFTCRGVIVYHDINNNIYGGAAFFRGYLEDGEIWSVNGNGMPYEAVSDNCAQNQNSVTEKAVFRFETGKPEFLPIVSINLLDDGDAGEEWGLTYKSVYFKSHVRDGSSADHAGLSCSHLKRDFPQSKDGFYFIDPNRGSSEDAMLVYCAMRKGGWTHIQPANSISRAQHFTGSDGYKWLSDLNLKIEWKASDSQITALQAMSTNARTRLHFDCRGVLVYRVHYNGGPPGSLIGDVLKLRTSYGDNNAYFWVPAGFDPQTSSPNYNYVVANDGCYPNDYTWRSADFLFESNNALSLPFRDLAVSDIGDSGEQWGVTFSDIEYVTSFDAPIGSTKDTAALNCREIYYSSYPHPRSGFYFIDPNGGSTSDAIFVECDMENGGRTGLKPLRQVPFRNWYSSGDGYRWFTDMNGGYLLDYGVPDSQLDALQAASTHAFQEVTIGCQGVITVHYQSSVYGTPIVFSGGASSRYEWSVSSPPHLRFSFQDYLHDTCRDNSEAYTGSVTLTLDTLFPGALPVRNFKLADAGDPNEKFSADISMAWFDQLRNLY